MGVIASLIYLALQVRQNTAHIQHSINSMQDAALRDARAMHNELSQLLSADGGFTRIYRLGMGRSPKLDADERIRFDSFIFQWFTNLETLFLLHQRESLENDQWIAMGTRLRMQLAAPGPRDAWERMASMFNEPFRRYVERELLGPPAV